MSAFPRSLIEFQRQFSDESSCAAYLAKQRWPEGFVCPKCGSKRGWSLETKAWTTECAGWSRQTSVTAGTVMHRSKLPLTVWFWAAYQMATHSNGISATQIRSQLGLGSYKTAWLLRAIPDFSGRTLARIVKETLAPGSTMKTDGWTGYAPLPISSTIPTSLAPWQRISCSPGFTAFSPT